MRRGERRADRGASGRAEKPEVKKNKKYVGKNMERHEKHMVLTWENRITSWLSVFVSHFFLGRNAAFNVRYLVYTRVVLLIISQCHVVFWACLTCRRFVG